MSQLKVYVIYHHVDGTHHDYQFAMQLMSDLRAAGADVENENHLQLTGSEYEAYLKQLLPNYQKLIVIQTPESLRSERMLQTVDIACQLSRQSDIWRVIAVACAPKEIPSNWASLKKFDASHDYKRALTKILLEMGLTGTARPFALETQRIATPPPPNYPSSPTPENDDEPVPITLNSSARSSSVKTEAAHDDDEPVELPSKPGVSPTTISSDEDQFDMPVRLHPSPVSPQGPRWTRLNITILVLILLFVASGLLIFGQPYFRRNADTIGKAPGKAPSSTSSSFSGNNATVTFSGNSTTITSSTRPTPTIAPPMGTSPVATTNRSLPPPPVDTNATATASANETAVATNNADAIATANAKANAYATALARTNADATATAQANANATATAQANANATAQANANATATTVAQANATATAIASATAYASSPQGVYSQSTSGSPSLSDPLSAPDSNNWDQNATCAFTGGSYHVSVTGQGYYSQCMLQSSNYADLAFQVQMSFVSGDAGGVIFRSNGSNAFYWFSLHSTGFYELYNPQPPQGTSPTLTQGYANINSGGTNTLTVIAIGNHIYLYINQQYLADVFDSSYSAGEIGFFANSINNSTEIAFSNAEVWTLP